MKITIATSDQRRLRDGEVVGGAPVVARRQAMALARAGVDVCLLDINAGSVRRHVEAWTWPNSAVRVESWEVPIDTASPFDPRLVEGVEEILRTNGSEDFLFVQEAYCGTVAKAAETLGRFTVWQPNDYSFLCARSWFLRGNGQRCDMRPGPQKCYRCQLEGRDFVESTALKGIFLFQKFGFRGVGSSLPQKCAAAALRATSIPAFLGCFRGFIAQSAPMETALRMQGVLPQNVIRVDYGAEVPKMITDRESKPHSPITFAFIARPTYEKGLHLVLRAWGRLHSVVRSQARLLVYAPIKSASHYQRKRLERLLAAAEGVEVRAGAVAHRLDEVYAEIDVAVQPSMWVDHNTQTILEALARRVPVIVPRHTSFNAGIVRDGENGLLIDLDDSESLSRAITRVICEAGLLDRLMDAPAYAFTDDLWAQPVLRWCRERSGGN